MLYDDYVKDSRLIELKACLSRYSPSTDWAKDAIQVLGHEVNYTMECCGMYHLIDAVYDAISKREKQIQAIRKVEWIKLNDEYTKKHNGIIDKRAVTSGAKTGT